MDRNWGAVKDRSSAVPVSPLGQNRGLASGRSLPVYPNQRTSPDQSGWSGSCHKLTFVSRYNQSCDTSGYKVKSWLPLHGVSAPRGRPAHCIDVPSEVLSTT